MSIWHSIVGSFWSSESACRIDKWLLLAFSVIFIIVHLGLAFWFVYAYSAVRRIKRKEREFLSKLKNNSDLIKYNAKDNVVRI